ncbi:MAG: sulfatase [Candidatus Sumerlaeia bacterium]
MSQPLNILYLHTHDHGRYIQPYGYSVPTPRLMQFAREGAMFRNAFCANPTCSPSRACLLTGQHAHTNGMYGLAHRGFKLFDYSHHLVRFLKSHGYYCVLNNSGAQHVAHKEDQDVIGYDEVLDVNFPSKKDTAAMVREWLDRRPQDKPFFLSVGYGDTHRDFKEPACDSDWTDPRYVLPPAPLPDTPETRFDMAAFNTHAREQDAKMAEVLDAIEKAGLAKNTIVIATTDHGIAFPRMKCNLEDSGIAIYLMLRGPGIPEGKVIDSLISHVDIFPTLCDLLGFDHPDWLQGTSLLPLMRDEKEAVRDEIFAEVNYHAAEEPMRCVRTKRWKYIRRYYDMKTPVLPNCDSSPSKDLWLEHGWAERELPREVLYDLVFDPNETNNLADDPDHATVLLDMRKRLQKWMEETDDPILKEKHPPAPKGATLTYMDARQNSGPTYRVGETKS